MQPTLANDTFNLVCELTLHNIRNWSVGRVISVAVFYIILVCWQCFIKSYITRKTKCLDKDLRIRVSVSNCWQWPKRTLEALIMLLFYKHRYTYGRGLHSYILFILYIFNRNMVKKHAICVLYFRFVLNIVGFKCSGISRTASRGLLTAIVLNIWACYISIRKPYIFYSSPIVRRDKECYSQSYAIIEEALKYFITSNNPTYFSVLRTTEV